MTETDEQRRARKALQLRKECKRVFREYEVAGLVALEAFYSASTSAFIALKLPDPPQTWKKGAFRNFCDGDESVHADAIDLEQYCEIVAQYYEIIKKMRSSVQQSKKQLKQDLHTIGSSTEETAILRASQAHSQIAHNNSVLTASQPING